MWCGAATARPEPLLLAGELGPLNRIAACRRCNGRRAGRSPAVFAVSLIDAGLQPDLTAIDAALRALLSSCTRRSKRKLVGDAVSELVMCRHPGESANTGKRRRLLARDGAGCVWCSRPLQATSDTCTFEHLLPRATGGPDRLENLLCACLRCNHARGRVPAARWAQLCEQRGQAVRWTVVSRALTALTGVGGSTGTLARSELESLDGPGWRPDADLAFELAYG